MAESLRNMICFGYRLIFAMVLADVSAASGDQDVLQLLIVFDLFILSVVAHALEQVLSQRELCLHVINHLVEEILSLH